MDHTYTNILLTRLLQNLIKCHVGGKREDDRFHICIKYLTISTFLGKIGKYMKPCVGEGLYGTFARPNLVLKALYGLQAICKQ